MEMKLAASTSTPDLQRVVSRRGYWVVARPRARCVARTLSKTWMFMVFALQVYAVRLKSLVFPAWQRRPSILQLLQWVFGCDHAGH